MRVEGEESIVLNTKAGSVKSIHGSDGGLGIIRQGNPVVFRSCLSEYLARKRVAAINRR